MTTTSFSAHAPLTQQPTARRVSRRRFLQGATVGSLAAPFIFEPSVRGASPNSKLNHACIGVGGMGAGDLQQFLQHKGVQVVAVCDVDANALKNAAKAAPGSRAYADWRELLAQEGDKIDSVNIAVPDHTHFPAAYTAIQAGKHVYCQKPLCHDVAEVRALTEASVKKGVVTQLGTQMAASAAERSAVQMIKSGALGKIKRAILCSNRPGAVENYRLKGPRPAQGQAAPAHLNWDLWIGSAPMRPFAPDIYHPTKWRAWLDFGTGWSGDIGCHIFDAVWKGLGLKPAIDVVAEVQESWKNSPERRADTWPQGDHITWTFPGNALIEGSQLTLEWFDGEFYPPKEVRSLYSAEEYPPESLMLIGTEGALLYPLGRTPILLPEEKFKNYPRPNVPGGNHYHLFADACRGGAKAESNFAQTGPMAEAIILGTVAIRVPGQKLSWDSARLRIPSTPEAERFLKRQYREGWQIRGV